MQWYKFNRLSGVLFILLALTLSLFADVSRSKVNKGIEAFQQEQWEEALNHFREALKADPENPLLHFNIGDAYYKMGKYEEALQAYQKAILTRDVTLQENAYYNLGNTYYQLQKYKEAVEAYKKALDLQPDDEAAKHNLELVRAKLKEMSQKQPQENPPPQKKIEPSEFAKQLKAEAERRIGLHQYQDAYYLMLQGLNLDSTVAAYQGFINRLKDVVEIEESS